MMVEQNSISAKQWMTKLVTLIFAIFANMKHSPQAKLISNWIAHNNIIFNKHSTKLILETVVYVGSIYP